MDISMLIETSPRHAADVLGQANIDIPNGAAQFRADGVYWADMNGVSVHYVFLISIRLFRDFQFFGL
jgi:hypothetical protein